MAVDSAAKRASVIGFRIIGLFIIPDGTLDKGDRTTIAGQYRGIEAPSAVALQYFWNSPYTRAWY